jgi:LmbE family N-acetylglucosaminyl deacetylase
MKVVAICSAPFDLEFCCFGTLAKYIEEQNEVNIIIANDDKIYPTEKRIQLVSESSKKIGVSEVYFTNGFDYSAVTQRNVKVLRLFIEKIIPSLAIIPFNNTFNLKRKVLSHSALIACHGTQSILMYELNKNPDFIPDTFVMIADEASSKASYLVAHSNQRKIKSLYKLYSQQAGNICMPFEAFKSHRITLIDTGF